MKFVICSQYQKNPVRVDRRVQRFAMCVPSSCKSTDLIISLNSTLYPIFQNHGLNISVNVDPIFCKTKNTSEHFQEYFIAKLVKEQSSLSFKQLRKIVPKKITNYNYYGSSRWIFVAFFLLLIYLTYYDVVTNTATNESKKGKRLR